MGSVQQIDNWLNSRRDVEAGRELLQSLAGAHPVSRVALDLITRFDNSGTRDLIAQELTAIRTRIDTAARPAPTVSRAHYLRKQPTDLPDSLRALRAEVDQISIERHVLRGKSRALQSESKELRTTALRIVEIAKRRAFIYERLDYFAQYGIELEPPMTDRSVSEQVRQLTSWLRAKDTHPPYISKNKNSKDPKTIAEVERRRKELEEIKEYLQNAD